MITSPLRWLPERKVSVNTFNWDDDFFNHASELAVFYVKSAQELTEAAKACLEAQHWGFLAKALKSVGTVVRRKPSTFAGFQTAGLDAVVMDTLNQLASNCSRNCKSPADLVDATAQVLLYFAQASEDMRELIASLECISKVLQLLEASELSFHARRCLSHTLWTLASTKLGYRDKLREAGATAVLLRLLRSLGPLCDPDLTQDILWSLVALCEPESPHLPHIHEMAPDIVTTLLPLLHLYLLPCCANYLHVGALIVRALHVVVAEDDSAKEMMRTEGGIPLVVELAMRGLEELQCMTPRPVPLLEPLGFMPPSRRISSPQGLFDSARDVRQSKGGDSATEPQLSASIGPPSEICTEDLQSPTLLRLSMLQVEAALGFSPIQGQWMRMLFAHLVQAACKKIMGEGVAATAAAAIMMPVMSSREPQLDGRRLGCLKESLGAAQVLMCDSPHNQDVFARRGFVQLLIQVIRSSDIDLAWRAVEASSYLSESHAAELVSAGAVEALTGLLAESASPMVGRTSQRVDLNLNKNHRPRLLGQRRVSLCGGGGMCCMYSNHSPSTTCDFCVPSSVLKALLRLSAGSSPGGADAAADIMCEVVRRLVVSGGLRAVLVMLDHEAGVAHHSKLASSCVSLLNVVMAREDDYMQDEVRDAGGVPIMVGVLRGLMRPGITDIYQLRVKLCLALQGAVEGNAATKLMVREWDLFPPLLSLLSQAAGIKSGNGPEVPAGATVDDAEQMAAAALGLIAACLPRSKGNQDSLLSLGLVPLLMRLLTSSTLAPATISAAAHATGQLAEDNPGAAQVLIDNGVLPCLLYLAEHAPGEGVPASVATALGRIAASSPACRSTVRDAGTVTVLIRVLNHGSSGATTVATVTALLALAADKPSLVNDIATQGGLAKLIQVIQERGPCLADALRLLRSMAEGNSTARNMIRTTPCVSLLLDVMETEVSALSGTPQPSPGGRPVERARPMLSISEGGALPGSSSAQSTTGRDVGWSEEAIRIVTAAERFRSSIGSEAGTAGSNRQGDLGLSATKLDQVDHGGSQDDASTKTGTAAAAAPAAAAGASSLSVTVDNTTKLSAKRALFPTRSLDAQARAGTSAHMLHAGLAAAALTELCLANHGNQNDVAGSGVAATLVSLLTLYCNFRESSADNLREEQRWEDLSCHAIRLIAALCEFNTPNKHIMRDSGCIALLIRLLVTEISAAEDGAKRRPSKSSLEAAATLAILAADCGENQELLSKDSGVAGALLDMLEIADPRCVLVAATALEHIVIRSLPISPSSTNGMGNMSLSTSSGEFDDGILVNRLINALQRENTAAAVNSAAATLDELLKAGSTVTSSIENPAANAGSLSAAYSMSDIPSIPIDDIMLPVSTSPESGAIRLVNGNKSGSSTPPSGPGLFPAPLGVSVGFKGKVPANNGGPATPPPVSRAASLPQSGVSIVMDNQQGSQKVWADHSLGLAFNADLSGMRSRLAISWTELASRAASTNAQVVASVPAGPWQQAKVQVAWLLLLLLCGRPALISNRVSRLLRTSVRPLARQLEHAESFAASAVLRNHELGQQG